jgi:hypothetical protein
VEATGRLAERSTAFEYRSRFLAAAGALECREPQASLKQGRQLSLRPPGSPIDEPGDAVDLRLALGFAERNRSKSIFRRTSRRSSNHIGVTQPTRQELPTRGAVRFAAVLARFAFVLRFVF